MSPKLLWGALVALAAGVGTFHAWIKPDLDRGQVGQIQEMMVQSALWPGRLPPDFDLPLLDGERFVLADHVGRKVVAINFFATWCAPCREEMPELERFHQQHEDDAFLIVGVDVDEDRELVEKFVDEVQLTFPVALDRDGLVAGAYQARSFPTTVVVGLDGKVQLYEVGAIANAEIAFTEVLAQNRRLRELDKAITREEYLAALAEQPPLPSDDDDEPSGLTGRALEIAQAMPCPCGCDERVEECGCSTADKITARLARMDLDERTDTEVMEELGKEFCVGAGS